MIYPRTQFDTDSKKIDEDKSVGFDDDDDSTKQEYSYAIVIEHIGLQSS